MNVRKTLTKKENNMEYIIVSMEPDTAAPFLMDEASTFYGSPEFLIELSDMQRHAVEDAANGEMDDDILLYGYRKEQ